MSVGVSHQDEAGQNAEDTDTFQHTQNSTQQFIEESYFNKFDKVFGTFAQEEGSDHHCHEDDEERHQHRDFSFDSDKSRNGLCQMDGQIAASHYADEHGELEDDATLKSLVDTPAEWDGQDYVEKIHLTSRSIMSITMGV